MSKIKLTPLFIALVALEVFLLFLTFNYLAMDNNGGNALGGIIALMATFTNVILIAIEQTIVQLNGNTKILWAIEIVIIIAVIIYVAINGISIG